MPEFSAGIHLEKAAGQTYTIHIPHRHTKGEQVPLILLLHWGGRNFRYIGRNMLEQLGLPALSGMQAVMAAPDRKRKHWATPKASQDLIQLVSYLDSHYNLHPTQRVVVGFSIGGMGVWHLAAEQADLFTCGVSLAALIPKDINPGTIRSPIFAIHSELDEIFPYQQNLELFNRIKANQPAFEFHSVPSASHGDIRSYIPALAQSIPWIESIWARTQTAE